MVLSKKFLIGFLSLILFLALVGCKNDSASTDEKDNDGATSENDTSPFTFTYFNAGSPGKDIDSNKTKIGKIFEEQTGTNVKMEFLVGDINTKIGTMIASGQYPDVLNPDIAIDKVLEAEAFIPLNELIDEHAPNLKKLYEPYLDRMKAEDGNIYFIPFGASQGHLPNPNIDQGAFFIQRGVLKEFGYPKIKTLDQYFELIEQYQAKYPEVDGASTIGFTALTYDWRFFSTTNTPAHLAGYPNDGEVIVDMETHEAKVYGNSEYTKRWLEKLNDANTKGLFDKEAFVANYDEYLAKLTSGRVLGFFDYGWQISQAENALKEAGDEDKRYMPLPIVFDENIKDQYIEPPSFVNNRGIGITVSAKDPVRIMKFLDNMAKEENQKLIMWGIEGETFVNDNGRYIRTDEQIATTSNQEFREEFGFQQFEWYWPRGNGLFSDGNAWEPRRQPEVAQASYTDGDKEILAKYEAEVFADLFSDPDDRPWYPAWSAELEQGSPAQIYIQKKTDLQRKYFPKLVLEANFEAIWEEYLNEYNKLDVKEYEKTLTEIVKQRIEDNK
ncbi:ABC transporter substrate-binding protein [Litchfieldia salsa]|uniref:Aldotetraouronic acid ABC transporter substrate-binding protein n=1 Tax=Litchfieldia salsa TaxID=930152 RepID=A0A1H0PCD7_9BACI|nr:ABC transporter substrate-binding protein [Litchfieldia salsa]SDP02365.1 aldotetraouronic acid ABC transporter substrate-binding protein [Litchfieldia salsa]